MSSSDSIILSEASQCIYQVFHDPSVSAEYKCSVALDDCQSLYSMVNFFQLVACNVEPQMYWIFYLLGILVIFLIFKFISETIEGYVSPSIVYITEWLKISESLAAVTLLALANGAGDVITALVASGEEGGVSYNIGALFGAGLFVLTVVVAVTILKSEKPVQLEASIIYRDIGFYIISTVVTVIFAIFGELTIFTSVLMLLIYAAMVVVVLIQDKLEENQKEEKKPILPGGGLSNVFEMSMGHGGKSQPSSNSPEKGKLSRFKSVASQIIRTSRILVEFKKKKEEKRAEEHEKAWKDLNWHEKLSKITDMPFNIARKATMPPCEENEFSKTWAMIYPIPFFLLLFFGATMSLSWVLLGVAIVLGSLVTGLTYFTTQGDTRPKWFIIIAVFGVFGGLLWTYLISSVLIDLLQFYGVFLGLEKTYLGLTILAIGNALPDALTTVSLAGQGFAIMGISGGYAGQLFGLLVGFGIAMLKQTIIAGPQSFNLFDMSQISTNILSIVVLFVALFCLCLTFFYGISTKYVFGKGLAYSLLVSYVLFFLFSTGIAISTIIRLNKEIRGN